MTGQRMFQSDEEEGADCHVHVLAEYEIDFYSELFSLV
jgi:hypothetical protein